MVFRFCVALKVFFLPAFGGLCVHSNLTGALFAKSVSYTVCACFMYILIFLSLIVKLIISFPLMDKVKWHLTCL